MEISYELQVPTYYNDFIMNLQKKYGTVIFWLAELEISREAISVKKDLPN